MRDRLEALRPLVIMRTPGFEPRTQIISDGEDAEEVAESPSKSRKLNNGLAQRTPQRAQTTATPRATPYRRGMAGLLGPIASTAKVWQRPPNNASRSVEDDVLI